jgi:hypothetical protein
VARLGLEEPLALRALQARAEMAAMVPPRKDAAAAEAVAVIAGEVAAVEIIVLFAVAAAAVDQAMETPRFCWQAAT